MSILNAVCSLQIIQRIHIKNCLIINPDCLNALFKIAKNSTLWNYHTLDKFGSE